MNTSYINNQPIDLVYLWCDMSDERWNERRREEMETWRDTIKLVEEESVARYQSHDELRYSLRSVEMYAPWIRNIFIVVCDYATIPAWLNTSNPRIHIVRHSEIIPVEYLPCYNSSTILHFISRIKDLSEYFLYSDDDMFFFDYVDPGFFFDVSGLPKRRVSSSRIYPDDGAYSYMLYNTFQLVKAKHPNLSAPEVEMLRFMPYHCIDAYRKSHYTETFERYRNAIEPTLGCPFRRPSDILRSLYLMEETLTYGAKTFIRDISFPDSICLTGIQWRKGFDNALRLHPKLLCINSGHENTTDDFKWLTLVEQILYPKMSEFENSL